jgi:hypothetical protein
MIPLRIRYLPQTFTFEGKIIGRENKRYMKYQKTDKVTGIKAQKSEHT